MSATVSEPEVAPAPPRAPLRLRAAVVAVCAVVGFGLVTQVRAVEPLDVRLAGEREEDLARILADLGAESERLSAEITELQLTILAIGNEQEGEQVAVRSLQRRLDDLQILAGTVPATGQGIEFTINDPDGVVGADRLVDVVQELRDAGAEVLAVNGTRLVASSAFLSSGPRMLLDGQPIAPPYRFAAIGPSASLAGGLEIPGGVLDALATLGGVSTEVREVDALTVAARGESVPFTLGRPVPAEEATPAS
jgi:uncharacterized protein YlxW (UPF0749 family)